MATSFPAGEIPDEKFRLSDEVLPVGVGIDPGIPAISKHRDHRASDAGFVDEQDPFAMVAPGSSFVARVTLAIQRFKDVSDLYPDAEVVADVVGRRNGLTAIGTGTVTLPMRWPVGGAAVLATEEVDIGAIFTRD